MPADAQTPFANLQKSKFSTTEPLNELNDIITYNNSCSISSLRGPRSSPTSSSARTSRRVLGVPVARAARDHLDEWLDSTAPRAALEAPAPAHLRCGCAGHHPLHLAVKADLRVAAHIRCDLDGAARDSRGVLAAPLSQRLRQHGNRDLSGVVLAPMIGSSVSSRLRGAAEAAPYSAIDDPAVGRPFRGAINTETAT
jgi:hypothetical protein